jgi:hypothetical protein
MEGRLTLYCKKIVRSSSFTKRSKAEKFFAGNSSLPSL